MKKDTAILVIDSFPEKFLAALESLSSEVTVLDLPDRATVLAHLPRTEVLVMNSRIKVDAEALECAPKLKLLCRAGVGMDHFDLPLLAEKGVKVVNTPGANAQPVGEQTVGMLLGLLHKLAKANREVRNREWNREPNRGLELAGRTVGIIGFGNTGMATARCLKGFGCRVLAYDKYRENYGGSGVEAVSLETIFQEADVLSLHVPLTEETREMVNASFLGRFQNPIWLLNLARGPVVNLAALADALESGKVLGAALDVLPNEKLATYSLEENATLDRLFAFEQVLFSPHVGGWSFESLERINGRLLKAVQSFVQD